MKVGRKITGPVVVIMGVHIPLIPDFLQPCQVLRLVGGQLTRFSQHGFPDFLAPAFRPRFIHLQSLEKNVLLGIHDPKEVLQGLAVVVGAVHMDMEATAVIDFRPGAAYCSDALLKLGQFRIFQL